MKAPTVSAIGGGLLSRSPARVQEVVYPTVTRRNGGLLSRA
jgi:hypothetical protein